MKSFQDTITLARVTAELEVGLINITDHMSELDRIIARGGEASVERRELWRMETAQAGLGKERARLVDRMSHEERPSVVLVVEDEILVLMAATTNLEAAGFTVHEACNADDALALLDSHEAISAVFTDVQMPGTMDGLALAQEVHLWWPAVKVLVTSGNALCGAGDMVRGDQFVRKPYRADEVIAALRSN